MAKHVLYMIWAHVDRQIEDDWNQWMDETHIPNVAKAEGFIGGRKYKLQRDAAGLSFNYVTIYEIESMEAYERYRVGDYADSMRQEVSDRYGNRIISARTVLEEIS
jgi:hypothetical protein